MGMKKPCTGYLDFCRCTKCAARLRAATTPFSWSESACPVCDRVKRGEWIDRVTCDRCGWSHDTTEPTEPRDTANAAIARKMWIDLMGEVTP